MYTAMFSLLLFLTQASPGPGDAEEAICPNAFAGLKGIRHISTKITPTTLEADGTARLVIRLESNTGQSDVSPPDLNKALSGKFQILSTRPEIISDGASIEFGYTIRPMRTGTVIFPAIMITRSDSKGEKPEYLESEPISITVNKSGSPNPEKNDTATQKSDSGKTDQGEQAGISWPAWAIAIISIVIMAGGAILFRILSRRGRLTG